MLVNDNLRSKFRNRARSVLNSRDLNFAGEIKIFYDFLRSSAVLNAILIKLEATDFDLDAYLEGEDDLRNVSLPDNYIEKISMCNCIMKKIANGDIGCLGDMFFDITVSDIDDTCHAFSKQYFYPLFEYFDEQLGDGSTMLYLLDKYRHRTEWFHKKKLYDLYLSDTSHGEELLTKDLQEYLHSQGVDYPFSTPLSPSGRTDLVGMIETSDPLVLEVKLFNLDKGYDKAYVRKGLVQAFKYALDYGKPIGYLMVFNLGERDIYFDILNDEPIKSIQLGNKVIYIICVNIYDDGKSASERKKPLHYLIEDAYLRNLEEAEK